MIVLLYIETLCHTYHYVIDYIDKNMHNLGVVKTRNPKFII